MSDEHLIQLEAMYQRHGAVLMRYLHASHAPADAEDLLQETLVQALRRLEQGDEVGAPRAWLFAIAGHVAATWRRRRRRWAAQALPDELPSRASPAVDPRLEAMREAIATLPAAHRQVLELRLRDELSYQEIAEALAIPVGTVRSRLHHAVRMLRTKLTDDCSEFKPAAGERSHPC